MQDHEQLNKILEKAGVSKTVYALVMPETESALDRVMDGGNRHNIIENTLAKIFAKTARPRPYDIAKALCQAFAKARAPVHNMYREAWTQKQDAMHHEFFETWDNWIAPGVTLDEQQFPHKYPTAGASEGLRVAINAYAADAGQNGFWPTIHIFEGEYEGFKVYAEAAGINVKEHNRKNWQAALYDINANDQFYISQPSAIDGNTWNDFDEFATSLHEKQPTAQIMMDLTYVGNISRPINIHADYPNIQAIFFSLSKPMGTYYHRIGGCLSRTEYPGLFGNKWFKNLMSMKLGTEMMKTYPVHYLPEKYAPLQKQAIELTNARLNLNLKPSDVNLLGTARPSENTSDLEAYLTRGSKGEELVRVCLTPVIASIIHPETDSTVQARFYETLKL